MNTESLSAAALMVKPGGADGARARCESAVPRAGYLAVDANRYAVRSEWAGSLGEVPILDEEIRIHAPVVDATPDWRASIKARGTIL